MPTEAEIKAPYITAHRELEIQFYEMGVITKTEFDLLHGQNWEAMRLELIAEGYLPQPTLPLEGFNPSNPAHDPPTRIEHIEEFLRKAYP